MAVSIAFQKPETEDEFEAMCLMLYQRILKDPGLMRVGRSGQPQFGVDLLGIDRRSDDRRSIGIQCKHYNSKKFSISTVISDVRLADEAKLQIRHLTFATTASASGDIVRQVHEISQRREERGEFTISVDFWETILGHIKIYPEVGRSYIPNFPGSTLLNIEERVEVLVKQTAADHAGLAIAQGQILLVAEKISEGMEFLQAAHSATKRLPESNGIEPDKFVVSLLDRARDQLKEGNSSLARTFLETIGDPDAIQDDYSKFRWHTNRGAVDIVENNYEEAATSLLKAFNFAPNEEKAHINRVFAYFLNKDYLTAKDWVELSILKFPDSANLWGLRLQIYSQLDLTWDESQVPPAVAEAKDYLFSQAQIPGKKGNHKLAVELIRKYLREDESSLDAKRLYLAEALMWASENTISAFVGQLSTEVQNAIENALGKFEPLERTLSSIQSESISQELTTNFISALSILQKADRARDIANFQISRHANLEQVVRIRYINLAEAEDFETLKSISAGQLSTLPPSALSILAEASANAGDLAWNSEILEVVTRREKEDVRLRSVFALRAFALWQNGNREEAVKSAQEYAQNNPDYIFGIVICGELLRKAGRIDEALPYARRCTELIRDNWNDAAALQVADLLASVGQQDVAANFYERLVRYPRNDEITRKLLVCLIGSDQRMKALHVLQQLPHSHRNTEEVIRLEINLAARMMDWAAIEISAGKIIKEGNFDADFALAYGIALHNLGKRAELQTFIKDNSVLKHPTLQQEVEFSKLEVAAKMEAEGLARLFSCYRRNPNNVKLAGTLIQQSLFIKSEHWQKPLLRSQGFAVELSSSTEKWWIVVDSAKSELASSWPEVVAYSSKLAGQLIEISVGDSVRVSRGMGQVNARIEQVISLDAYTLRKAHEGLQATASGSGPVWAARIVKDDGNVDIDILLQQAQGRQRQGEEALQFYKNIHPPIGLLAKFIGSNPISLMREWPGNGINLFVASGTDDEKKKCANILSSKGREFVIDLFTLTDVLRNDAGELLLKVIGRPLIPESQRQQLISLIDSYPRGNHVASLLEVKGRLHIVEIPENLRKLEQDFLFSLLRFIEERCTVIPTAGPLHQDKTVREVLAVLDGPSGDCLRLGLERNAVLLTEDGGLRALGEYMGFRDSVHLQAVWADGMLRHIIDHPKYVDLISSKIVAGHEFVSISHSDLIELAQRTPGRINPTAQAALETLKGASLNLQTGLAVCFRFISAAVGILPPATVADYTHLVIAVLTHNRPVNPKQLSISLARLFSVYGRNGRRLPKHVRRRFKGILSFV